MQQLNASKISVLVLTILLITVAVTHLRWKSNESKKIEWSSQHSRSQAEGGQVKLSDVNGIERHTQRRSIKKSGKRGEIITQNEWQLRPPEKLDDSLPQEVMDGIEKFAFFIGFTRSGHSIVGSFIDAHPNMIIAYQYQLFRELPKLGPGDRDVLYNKLYSSSHQNAISGWTSGQDTFKNYSLHVNYPWQGRYDKRISVIGDKAGGSTAGVYKSSPKKFIELYTRLQKMVKIPLKSVFVVRNPFDIIATHVLYHNVDGLKEILKRIAPEAQLPVGKDTLETSGLIVALYKTKMKQLQRGNSDKEFSDAKYDNEKRLEGELKSIAKFSEANDKLIDLLGEENVLTTHNENLVDDAKSELVRLCEFFEVECPSDYVQACADKVFKSVSRTRDFIVWPTRLRKMVEEDIIGRYKFFAKYTFESD